MTSVITVTRFLIAIGPDLARAGRALYRVLKGDVHAARKVLEILGDHAERLLAERVAIDRELTEMRAERAKEREES